MEGGENVDKEQIKSLVAGLGIAGLVASGPERLRRRSGRRERPERQGGGDREGTGQG
jgi:hypothetical protein